MINQHFSQGGGGSLTSRTLLAALLLGITPAMAAELADVDLSKIPLNKPTLDYLHENNVQIPQTEYDDEGNLVESGSILAPESAYTLTEVPAGTDGSAPVGDNIITKYELKPVTHYYDPVTGAEVAEADRLPDVQYKEVIFNEASQVYYQLNLKQTTYGEGNQSYSVTLENSPVKDVIINVLYDNTNTSGRLDINSGTNYGDITSNFIGNSASSYGGAIYNRGTIGDITGDFIGNSAYSPGGAIYNYYNRTIGNITGDFIGNSASNGGAIYNVGTIGDITGDFIGNYAADGSGGAIFNDDSTIGNITGDFIGNSAGGDGGGAISNFQGTIGDITSNFIGNYADEDGGAINNYHGTIGNITGDFIGNSASSSGAIDNTSGTIGDITGDFIGNSAGDGGGAINNNNSATIGDITGDFIGNSSDNTGGAIFNFYAIIGNITGDFIGNSTRYSGGAIDNSSGTIGDITGDFIGNYAADGSGGAIFNDNSTIDNSTIGNITGNFIGNSAKDDGGAIFNDATIGNITGDFIGNSANSGGGAIYNVGTIKDITGDFIGNSASLYGGAIENSRSTIGDITGDFIGNSARNSGGAINNRNSGSIEDITGDFIGNSASSYGGAIYNDTSSTIGDITGDFIGNSARSYGGAIYNSSGTIGDITSDFIGNSARNSGGAINNRNSGTIEDITGDFIGNSARRYGGAIYNNGTIGAKDNDNKIIGGIINSSFIDNYAQATNGDAKGGAIYSTKDLNIIADNAQTVFEGNYTENTDASGNTTRDDNAIYLDSADAALNFNLKNNGSVVMKDNIDGVDGYTVNITGDDINNTTFYLLNDIRNSNLTVANTTLNTINDSVHIYDVNSFTLAGDTNFVADVDLANKEMDRLTADSYGEHNGNLNVIGMNLLSDAVQGESVTAVYFAEPDLKNNVVNAVSGGTGDLPDSFQTTAYTPIYKYNVIYDKDNQYDGKGDGGYFVFAKGDIILPDEPDEPNLPIPPTGGGTTGNPSDAFNPAVLTTPVGNLAAGQAAMNETFKYVFEHADAFTQLPSMERYAKINANKYALSTDFNENMPSYAEQLHNNAVWFRPYTTFETMNIKNGPKVDAITYGSLVGFDGDFKEMKNGWSRIFTGYAGYMGSSLNYSGVDTTMNGGLLGFTETFYKGNFWTAITASAGASVGESHTMYGKEDYTSLLAGVGSKTGYNFEFKDGKFIIQPIMFLSYTFVNTFDYKNAAGVSIESDPLHTIQLNPSVRFIANLKGGWQPYASVGMVWNLMNESKVTANNVKLPEMSVKPYVEYGVGVQRNWADKFTAFLQAMIRNGGRNGVALTGGFRFMLGSDSKNSDKPKVKKEIKSL